MHATSQFDMVHYPAKTIARAERAMRCAPFYVTLFAHMVYASVALPAIAGSSGVRHRYTRRLLSELTVESELMWLIQVGLLRREVDGQGLTDSFRVTPLGRQLVQRWQQASDRDYLPSWRDRLYNACSRWLRFSF